MPKSKPDVSREKQVITDILKTLGDIKNVDVKISGHAAATIRITNAKHHGVDWYFKWVTGDHFVGYAVLNSEVGEVRSDALVSLYTPMSASLFCSTYAVLDMLRANQKS